MMTDIFSSFDPCINSMSSISIMVMILTLTPIMLSVTTHMFSSTSFSSWGILSIMENQSSRTNSKNFLPASILFSTLFFMIIMTNLLGMLPFFFSFSSHLLFTLSLGLPLWMSIIMSAMIKFPKKTMAHFLPSGAPTALSPFLVLIEIISTLVRPITLSFRLAANMSAGHIVLALMSTFLEPLLFSGPNMSLPVLMFTQSFYFMFEFAICLIQAYIFCLLLTLYSDDHPN